MTEIINEHNGHRITISDETRMLFKVSGPLINETFCEYAAARVKIDDSVAKREAPPQRRISVAVLDEKGRPQTVTGIHAANGNVLGLPKGEGYTYPDYYPNVAWIADTINRVAELTKQIEALNSKLSPFVMHGSGHDLIGKTHAEKVDALVVMIEEKTEAAKNQEK